jgi:hypothetical protein
VKYYVDGQLDGSTTFPSYITHFAIEIGYGGGSSDYSSLKGQVSNCVLHSSELTQPQIETLYNNGVPQLSPSFSPYGWWKCDNITTGIEDSIGSNNGTNNGAIQSNIAVSPNNGLSSGMDTTNLVPSNLQKSIPYSGYSMDFDGTDFIDLGTGLDIFKYNIDEEYSVSAWVNFTSTTADRIIISLGANTYKFFLATGASGKISFGVGNSTAIGSNYNHTPTAGTINDGNWHHICIVGSSNSGGVTNFTVYVDGISGSSGGSTTFIVEVNNKIGDGYYGGFDGLISNVSVFQRALSEDEVLRVYNGGVPGDLTNLNPTSWWSLGADSYFNGSNWICPDIGANTNNGTSDGLGADDLKGNGPNSLANGTSTNLNLGSNLIGEAPGSTGNAISINMNSLARTGSTP